MRFGYFVIVIFVIFGLISCGSIRRNKEPSKPSLKSTKSETIENTKELDHFSHREVKDIFAVPGSQAGNGTGLRTDEFEKELEISGIKDSEKVLLETYRAQIPELEIDSFELQEIVGKSIDGKKPETEGFHQAESLRGFIDKSIAMGAENLKMQEDESLYVAESSAKEMVEEKESQIMLRNFRVRSRFPEILYFNPNLVSGENGESIIRFPLSDSISTFDINVTAATKDGKWGRGKNSFRTFKDFFIDFEPPKKLHVGDIITLSAVLFNYAQKGIDLDLKISSIGNISIYGNWQRSIKINPSKAVEIKFQVKAIDYGVGKIQITAEKGEIKDSIIRTILVFPSIMEQRLNISGVLEKGKNSIKINIPEKAIVFDSRIDNLHNTITDEYNVYPQFWLRIYADPTLEAYKVANDLMNEPHASLLRSIAITNALIVTKLRIKELSESEASKIQNLDRMLETAWGRVLAFRSGNGFSFYPEEKPDDFANLLVLDLMKNLKKVLFVDEELINILSEKAYKYMLDGHNHVADRLYAAYLISDSDILTIKKMNQIMAIVETITGSDKTDLISCALAIRISLFFEKLKPALVQKYLALLKGSMNKDNLSESLVGLLRGGAYPFSISLICEIENNEEFKNIFPNDLKIKENENLKHLIISNLINVVSDSKSGAMKKIDAITALYLIGQNRTLMKPFKGMTLNGESIFDSKGNLVYGKRFNKKEILALNQWNEIPLKLRNGDNELIIETDLPYVSYQVLGKYYLDDDKGLKTSQINIRIPERITYDDVFHADLNISTSKDFKEDACIVHIQLPPGVKPIDSPKALARRVAADYAEIRHDEIILYFKNLKSNTNNKFILPMVSNFRGEFYIPPPAIESEITGEILIVGESQRVNLI